MRVVSSFHDYYDTVQAAGQDQSLVYLRKRREEDLTSETFSFPVFGDRFPPYFGHSRAVPYLSVVQHVVGFCGKIYPLFKLSHQRQSESAPKTALCYSLSDVDAFVESHFKRRHVEGYRSKPRGMRQYYDNDWSWKLRREQFEEFFNIITSKQTAYEHLFVESRCPIFVASTWWGSKPPSQGVNRQYQIVYNECLKELEFFRVLDTYTAYQELQMFFGNLAQPNKPIPKIADKDMVSIKGFNKWSFRKPPD